MSDLMREEFEKRFPVPFNADWSYEMQRYEWNEKDNSLSAAMEHNKIFEAWQSSRECLVIELPNPVDFPDGTGDYHQMIDTDDLIDAIHAAGVKTK